MSEVLHKGIEYRRRLTVTAGTVDISSSTVVVEIRRRPSASNLLSYSIGSGIALVSGGTTGLADLVVPAADSVPLESAAHYLRVLVDDQVALDWIKLSVRD